jgi:hypothetical protein
VLSTKVHFLSSCINILEFVVNSDACVNWVELNSCSFFSEVTCTIFRVRSELWAIRQLECSHVPHFRAGEAFRGM